MPICALKKKLKYNPVKQHRHKQEKFFSAKCWLPASRHALKSIRAMRTKNMSCVAIGHLEQGSIKIIAGKPAESAVMIVDPELSGHVNVSPTMSHFLLEFA